MLTEGQIEEKKTKEEEERERRKRKLEILKEDQAKKETDDLKNIDKIIKSAMEDAQNDPWLAAGKFYSAVSNITGPQYKAISAGRNNVTMTDIKETQNAFMDMAFMVAPMGISREFIGGVLYKIFRPSSFLNRGQYFRIGFGRFEDSHVFRISGEMVEKLFSKTHLLNWKIGPKSIKLLNLLKGQ